MLQTNSSWIFPAFGEKLLDKDIQFFQNNQLNFKNKLDEVSLLLGHDFHNIINEYDRILNNELYSQYIAFIFSCTIVDYLKNKRIIPLYTSGYSLGLYAALYGSSAINFQQGLLMIRHIFNLIKAEIKDKNYGIAIIIGFEYHDLVKLITENFKTIEIINQNNKYSHVISGNQDEVYRAVRQAVEEGAINSRILPIIAPYHSGFMHKPAELFFKFIREEIFIQDLQIPLVSTVNQRILIKREDAVNELVMNIKQHINWHETMKKLLSLNIGLFIECGIGRSLVKISKLIEGNYQVKAFMSL